MKHIDDIKKEKQARKENGEKIAVSKRRLKTSFDMTSRLGRKASKNSKKFRKEVKQLGGTV